MMGNSRGNEKGKAPASANSSIEANNGSGSSNAHPPSGLTFLEGNVDEDTFDSLLDMSLTFGDLGDFHRSVAPGIPETVANPNSFETPQVNLSSDTVNANLQGVPVLSDWNMSWGQQSVSQGHNGVSAGGISTSGEESWFTSLNRPQVNRDVTGSAFLLHPGESAPVHARNNASLNQSQSGIQGNFGGGFLSLRLGGTEESVSRSQLGSREISDKLKEAASNELKMARARKAMGQTLDADFMGFQSNSSGFSNQFCHENRMTPTNNEVGFHGSLNSWLGSSLQQNDMQHDKNIISRDLDHFRDEKVKEAVSTDLKMVHAQKATGQTSGQSINASFMDFHGNISGFSNQFSNMDRMNSTNNEVGVLGTLNSGLGAIPHQILQMHNNDSRNIRSGDLNHYRAFIGNQPVHSGTIGGNSAQVFNSQQLNLNKPSEFEKPSQLDSYYTPFEQRRYMRSTTANNPNYAGQVISQNATPSQVLGSNMFSQRTAAPQVSWLDSGSASNDEPFPKRLGVEFNVRNSLQTNQRHLSPMGTSFQTTSTGQVCQFPDKGLTRMTDHVLRPSVGMTVSPMGTSFQTTSTGQVCQFPDKGLTRLTDHVPRPSVGPTDRAPVSYPVNSQEPLFAHGQSHAPIQLAKGSQGAPSTNASTVIGQSQKPDLHIRPHHKRSAAAPHPASHWVQRQKIIHPAVHHSMPKPYIPVSTARVHPSIPVGPRTQPADAVAARIRPVLPCASFVRPRVPVTTAPAVSRITSKATEATPKLSGYKCYLCKRDLALTSEGTVYQPAAPPPVAILPCGHSFHDQCLQNITPDDQAKDPPCIPCAIGEQ